jgi:hypothetical protein
VIRFKQGIAFGELYEIGRSILIKVPDMILKELTSVNDVSQISALLRDDDAQRVLQSQRGSYGVRGGTDSADSLREIHGVKRVSAFQHFLKAPEKQALRPRVRYNVVIYVGVYLHEPADAGDGIDDHSFRFGSPLLCRIVADKRFHLVRKPEHSAAYAWAVVTDGPVHAVVPFPDGAVNPCDRPSASELEHTGFFAQL